MKSFVSVAALPRPVTLAWGGLAGFVLLVGGIAAARGPVFPGLDASPAASAGDAGGDEGSRERGEKRASSAPAGSAQRGRSGWDPLGAVASGTSDPVVAPGPDVRAAQAEFEARVRRNDIRGSLEALESLVALDPAGIKEPSTREQVVELSQRVMQLPGNEPERMFAVLSEKSGTAGLDILYYLVTAKGGSKASKQAERILASDEVIKRGTPAMQAAWYMRKATNCDAKKKLFSLAAEHGDARVLGQLQEMNRRCGRRNRSCCLHKDPDLEATMDAIKKRTGAQ